MQQDTQQNRVGASFRDPSGFIFRHEGVLYRQVNAAYQPDYDMLMASGLYERLVEAGLLIPHAEASLELARTGEAYKVLRPSVVEAISYP
ncbi:MAG: SAM-dependent methyltransferase, partial [Chloroflexi bacterium]|nr:SAM-dependent methyltransferase [Chloroflexota bacterium]